MPFTPLHRRTFLRAAGVAIGLPLLDAMLPRGLGALPQSADVRAKRLLLIGRGLGLHTPNLFPADAGKNYTLSPLLKPLEGLRQDFTVFSGMSHRGYPGGHGTEAVLFTGVPAHQVRPGDIRNGISLDQEIARRHGGGTRYPSLQLGGGDISWNDKGVKVPSESRASVMFKNLFIDGTPAEVEREIARIQTGQSILDGVRDQARRLGQSLGPADRDRIDLLLSSIRDAEQRLQQDQAWVKKPKPKVDAKPITEDHVTDSKMLERQQQWFDLAHLALQADSTRVIALWLHSHTERLQLDGLQLTHHDASHHGQDEDKLRQLALIEVAEMRLFAEFLAKMKQTNEAGRSLLDDTVVLYSSNLGNASAHTCDNLPVLLAGGSFNHAGHVAFDRKNNAELSNLFVRVLQQMGIERDRFGDSNGVISEV